MRDLRNIRFLTPNHLRQAPLFLVQVFEIRGRDVPPNNARLLAYLQYYLSSSYPAYVECKRELCPDKRMTSCIFVAHDYVMIEQSVSSIGGFRRPLTCRRSDLSTFPLLLAVGILKSEYIIHAVIILFS